MLCNILYDFVTSKRQCLSVRSPALEDALWPKVLEEVRARRMAEVGNINQSIGVLHGWCSVIYSGFTCYVWIICVDFFRFSVPLSLSLSRSLSLSLSLSLPLSLCLCFFACAFSLQFLPGKSRKNCLVKICEHMWKYIRGWVFQIFGSSPKQDVRVGGATKGSRDSAWPILDVRIHAFESEFVKT